ncbi:PAQR family membrane homeostasis protein TrhA [Oenococcus oeni]|uniref:Hemolysin III n=1 Tax=Oenococcus oeni TaxID=1247 RepID=A0AAJ2P0F1_OENOE|nr:hemolysin III family protein [Oenococcus oeni]MDV7714534.1 hemolysin III [Oenococcus oeni]
MDSKKHSVKTFGIVEEIFNSITHGLGFAAAIIGIIFLFIRAVDTGYTSAIDLTAFIIYSVCLIIFLLNSTLFHALIFTRCAWIFQHFDHLGIFLIILATYTPFCWIFIKNPIALWIWVANLILAIGGIVYDFMFIGRYRWISVLIYLAMGWLIVFLFPIVKDSIPTSSLWMLFWGGISYSAGTFFYLNTRIWWNHVWWHLFVLLGTALMYSSIYLTM